MAETTVKRRHHRVLAIETGSPRGSVAAAHDDHTVARLLGHDGQHGRLVTQALAAVAEEAGFPARAADLVVVVRGPGSFTGLRVGVALAKTLAWSTGAALVGVSGYELIARRVGAGDGPVWVVFEAGRGYVAACRCERRAVHRRCGTPTTSWRPFLPATDWRGRGWRASPPRLLAGPTSRWTSPRGQPRAKGFVWDGNGRRPAGTTTPRASSPSTSVRHMSTSPVGHEQPAGGGVPGEAAAGYHGDRRRRAGPRQEALHATPHPEAAGRQPQ